MYIVAVPEIYTSPGALAVIPLTRPYPTSLTRTSQPVRADS